MDDQQFFKLGLATKALQEKAPDAFERNFWDGYRQGLRRKFHGERSGTDEEHARWMSLAEDSANESERLRGIGYRAGFEEMEIPRAIEYLKGILLPH